MTTRRKRRKYVDDDVVLCATKSIERFGYENYQVLAYEDFRLWIFLNSWLVKISDAKR